MVWDRLGLPYYSEFTIVVMLPGWKFSLLSPHPISSTPGDARINWWFLCPLTKHIFREGTMLSLPWMHFSVFSLRPGFNRKVGRKSVRSLSAGEVEKIVREQNRLERQRIEMRLEKPMTDFIYITLLLRSSPGDNYRLV